MARQHPLELINRTGPEIWRTRGAKMNTNVRAHKVDLKVFMAESGGRGEELRGLRTMTDNEHFAHACMLRMSRRVIRRGREIESRVSQTRHGLQAG